jgi:hypothetical protein
MDIAMEVEDDTDAIWLDDGACVRDSASANNDESSVQVNDSKSAGSETFVINRTSLEDYHQLGRKITEDALRQLKETQDFQRWEQKCSMYEIYKVIIKGKRFYTTFQVWSLLV